MRDNLSFKEASANLVQKALDGQMEFLVLRGLDNLAREGGDIDVLVPRNHSKKALLLVARMAVETGWSIAGIANIGYLSQICLVRLLGDVRRHQAIKIDFFNGASWRSLGKDPLGAALFEVLEKNGESEAIGLTTLLQKLLYAGYLRNRDWERISASCDTDQIEAFFMAANINLTQTDLERGTLDMLARWKLRAVSSGVKLANLPIWITQVIWRKLVYSVVLSSMQGSVFVIFGSDALRRLSVAERFRALVLQSEFLEPLIKYPDKVTETKIKPWSWKAACIWWRVFRGETVLVDGASFQLASPYSQSTGLFTKAVQVKLPDDRLDIVANDDYIHTDDDLDTLLACVSKQVMQTLERTQMP